MADFTTRVELIDATEADYVKLHRLMEAELFMRYVVGTDGVQYKLPPATYVSQGQITATDVREHARKAARGTGKSFRVFVSGSDGSRAWDLEPVNKLARPIVRPVALPPPPTNALSVLGGLPFENGPSIASNALAGLGILGYRK